MSPEYFHTRLTFYEARDYIAGVNRRYHTAWNVSRWITSSIAGAAGAKNYKAPEFEWEKHNHKPDQITQADIAEMKRMGAQWAAQLNKAQS